MKKFNKIYIEITNICNLNCSFCPSTIRKKEYMNVDFFENILERINKYTKYIYLHIKGEPFVHPKLKEILKIAENKGIFVNITTNGVLIKEVEEILLSSKCIRQINFSLHSFEEGTLIDKKKYMYKILEFCEKAKEIYISLRLWNLTDNSTIEKINEYNKFTLELIKIFFKINYEIKQEFIRGKGIKLRDKIYLNYEEKFEWPSLLTKLETSTGYCHGLRNQLGILVDGTVVPCCLDNDGIINLGNIKENSLEEILNSDRAKNIYKGFSERKVIEELCKKCSFKNRF